MQAVFRRPVVRFCYRLTGVVGLWFLVAASVAAQPAKPAEPPRAGAIKLPDGTIVFFTPTPDEPNPPIEGVLLSPQEYKALTEQAEQLKKLKEAPKAQAPSACRIAGKLETRGERTVAALTLTYTVRTSALRTPVALGGQRAFPLAARLGTGGLPVLSVGEEGLTAWIETPGDHTLTVEVETPVGPRGTKGEQGFELGLPRAAITTLTLTPPTGVARLTVGVRTAAERGADPRRTVGDAAALARAPIPLGAAEMVEVTWAAPTATPAVLAATLSAELDVTVRVEETQIETTGLIRLRGPAQEWTLLLPPGADVEAKPAAPALPLDGGGESPLGGAATPALTRPTDPSKPAWTFRPPPGGGSEWILTVTSRRPRPKVGTSFAVGPFTVPTAARQSGTVKVFAPPTVRLGFKHPSEVRRQDLPIPEEDLVALFRFAAGPKSPAVALLEFEISPARTFVRVQPAYTLRRVEEGWRLEAELAVTPVRTETDHLILELPAGWQALEAGPLELVEEVQEVDDGDPRQYSIRLLSPQKNPFTLNVTALFPLDPPAGRGELALPMPRFPRAEEFAARVTATVPDGLEVRGTATAVGGGSRELKSTSSGKGAAVTIVSAQFEKSLGRVDLAWQPYRPALTADIRAQVLLHENQALVHQKILFRPAEGGLRPILLRGPSNAVGLKAVPPLDQPGPTGEWLLRPPADGSKEFTLSVSYALPILPRKGEPAGPLRQSIGLLWPEAATRVETGLKVWGAGTSRRVSRFEGPWRELPPEPVPEFDSLPWLSLIGTGAPLPLTLELGEPAGGTIPGTEIEGSLMQVWLGPDGGLGVRGLFRLRRWSPAGVDVELPLGVLPELAVDGKRVEPLASPRSEPTGPRIVRVPIPEPRAGQPAMLDVRYVLPASGEMPWELQIVPPRLPAAAFRAPVQWQVFFPAGTMPLSFGRDLRTDLGWGTRRGAEAGVPREADRWFSEFAPPGDVSLTGHQAELRPVRLYRVPLGPLVVVCSVVVAIGGFGLIRLRPALIGPALALVGLAATAAAILWPQPTATAAAAALPGLGLLALLLLGAALVRWYYRRRVDYLPGFTRGQVLPSGSAVTGTLAPSGRSSQQPGSAVIVLEGSHPEPSPSGS